MNWPALLGREPGPRKPATIPQAAGRCVLVTGAGGFIGSAMVHALAASHAERIVLLDHAEQPLFSLWSELTAGGLGERCVPVLASVCDRGRIGALFQEHQPAIVIHAAALKHVPLMERNPLAAIATNAVGTWMVARMAAQHGTRRMIFVSTDKAVAPHSIMGASKRIAELAVLAHPRMATVVRLVNVLGSPGSVGPIFAGQIAHGGPVTVTHPAARRFFLTLEEVTALLAEAIEAGAGEDVLVPDPGEAILIGDLARRMMALAGREVPVVFTEPRPGDKLDEALWGEHETLRAEPAGSLRRVASPGLADSDARLGTLEDAVAAGDLPPLLRQVEELVPDYRASALVRAAAAEAAAAGR